MLDKPPATSPALSDIIFGKAQIAYRSTCEALWRRVPFFFFSICDATMTGHFLVWKLSQKDADFRVHTSRLLAYRLLVKVQYT
jgi:hypothetical protein